MDAAPALGDCRQPALELRFEKKLLALWIGTGMALLATAGVLLVARRLSGALAAPLAPGYLLMLGSVLSASGLLFRRAVVTPLNPGGWRLAASALPTVAMVAWVCGVAIAGTSAWGLVLLVALVGWEEGWSWSGEMRGRTIGAEPEREAEPAAEPLSIAAETVAAEPISQPPVELHPGEPPAAELRLVGGQAEPLPQAFREELAAAGRDEWLFENAERDAATSQQIVRRSEPSGEVLEGWTRADFAAGQRVSAAHLAICPPLTRIPVCYAEPAEGPDAEVRVTQAFSHGVRLEVKLDQPAAEPTSVIVEFSIQENGEGADEEVSQRREGAEPQR